MTKESEVSKRGFASMPLEQRRAIASMGGKALSPEQRAFSQNRELAASAGRKGGLSVDPANRSFSTDAELARRAGVKGSAISVANRRKGKS